MKRDNRKYSKLRMSQTFNALVTTQTTLATVLKTP